MQASAIAFFAISGSLSRNTVLGDKALLGGVGVGAVVADAVRDVQIVVHAAQILDEQRDLLVVVPAAQVHLVGNDAVACLAVGSFAL